MTKRGRPRAIEVNSTAVLDLLEAARRQERTGPTTQAELAAASGVTPSHLTDMLRRAKGANRESIDRMAFALNCKPETIAPTLTRRFVAVRDSDVTTDSDREAS